MRSITTSLPSSLVPSLEQRPCDARVPCARVLPRRVWHVSSSAGMSLPTIYIYVCVCINECVTILSHTVVTPFRLPIPLIHPHTLTTTLTILPRSPPTLTHYHAHYHHSLVVHQEPEVVVQVVRSEAVDSQGERVVVRGGWRVEGVVWWSHGVAAAHTILHPPSSPDWHCYALRLLVTLSFLSPTHSFSQSPPAPLTPPHPTP